ARSPGRASAARPLQTDGAHGLQRLRRVATCRTSWTPAPGTNALTSYVQKQAICAGESFNYSPLAAELLAFARSGFVFLIRVADARAKALPKGCRRPFNGAPFGCFFTATCDELGR